MSKSSLHALIWSEEHQYYELVSQGRFQRAFRREDEPAWLAWLNEQISFAFQGLAGHLSVLKEARSRGGGYWYAYRRQARHTHKRYLGRTAILTFAYLEETALSLGSQHPSPALSRSLVSQKSVVSMQGQSQPAQPRHSTLSEPSTPLLDTKLHPPRLRTLLVPRVRLLALLDEGQRLTLLHAPAGFGKTTLVTQWIAHHKAQARLSPTAASPLDLPGIAWISLDVGDNDPVRFWFSLITTCQAFHPHIGQTALAHLFQTPRLPFTPSPLETTLTFLLNDLARSVQEGVLILEDYHLIEHTRIHETMAFFIEHLPTSLHIIIMTRSIPPLPLVRWRAQGTLLEVSSHQLRFSTEETATFLQQVIPQTLSPEAVRSLHAHLEGWAAGLRLFTLSVQSQMTPQPIEVALTRLHIDSAADWLHQPIQAFFLSEILAVQPESLQLFLLQTCMLSRLTGSLCDCVTGRQDSTAWLEQTEHVGFFLEVLESQGTWYRYHALFAEMMRTEAARRLGAETLRHLSLRASHWYEEHSMLVEAIEATLFAQQFDHAAHLIEKLNEATYFSEHDTMRRWLEKFPDPVLRSSPTLCFLFVQARLFSEVNGLPSWRIEAKDDLLLHLAEEGWRREGNLSQVGILSAFRATFTLLQGHLTLAVVYAHQALQLLPPASAFLFDHPSPEGQRRPAEWNEWHCGSLLTIGLQAMQTGSFDTAHQFLLEAYTLSLNNKDHVFTRITRRTLGDICTELGNLQRAAEYYQQTAHEPSESHDLVHLTSVLGLARLSYEWNELETAEQLAHNASEYRYTGDLLHWEDDARMQTEHLRLRLLHARGEVVQVHTALSALLIHLQATPRTLQLIPEVLTWQARMQIEDGDLAAAEQTLDTLAYSENMLSPQQEQTIHLLQARLFLAQGQTTTALHLLEEILTFAQQRKHIIRVLEIQLLMTLAHDALKQRHKAQHQLSEVLAQAHKGSFLRLFLNEGEPLAILLRSLLPAITEKPLRVYAQRILQSFPTRASTRTDNLLLEPLSAQEQRVLTLLVAGRSNPEIAEVLIVSVNTIKGHVKNLYRKLDVTNRIQAGEVARHLKLI